MTRRSFTDIHVQSLLTLKINYYITKTYLPRVLEAISFNNISDTVSVLGMTQCNQHFTTKRGSMDNTRQRYKHTIRKIKNFGKKYTTY